MVTAMLMEPEAPAAAEMLMEAARAHVRAASGFLLDWDGCCVTGDRLTPGAAQFLRAVQGRAAIVSNNSTDTETYFLNRLRRAGVNFGADRVSLAGVAALDLALERGTRRILLLAGPKMTALARRRGFELTAETPEAVVLMRDTKLSYPRLELAANAIARGAALIAANPDRTHPGPDGRVVPETGALVAALGACVDLSRASVTIVGKPANTLYERACTALRLPRSDVLMIGDNPDTDAAGAAALGMPCLLVGPNPKEFFWEAFAALKSA